jgi:drug/metabolite transporter (DMT)-like permease
VIAILLAAAAAVGWGASDYFGGDASRRDTPVFVIVALTELLGTLAVVPFLAAGGTPLPDSPRLLFAVLAGISVTCELGLIYRALGQGDAFMTAPVGALGAAISVGAGLITGDSLGPLVLIGLALALLGGGASAWTSPGGQRPGGSRWRAAATCAAAAVAVATTLICLHAAGPAGPYWVTMIEHLSTAISAGLIAVVATRGSRRHLPRLPGLAELPRLGLIAAAGTGADLAYVTASVGGALSIVSAVSSLYPVTTIALGRALQGQRPTRLQAIGITLALAGAVLLGFSAR